MIYTLANTVQVGRRVKVFVNGNPVERAVFADTSKGVVRYIPQPTRIKKGTDYVYTRTLRGVVTVEAVA